MAYNYFEVLGLSIDEIQDKDEATIKVLVSNAHTEEYKKTVGAYANVPRRDGLTQIQLQKVLNDAKETLLNPRKRRKHMEVLIYINHGIQPLIRWVAISGVLMAAIASFARFVGTQLHSVGWPITTLPEEWIAPSISQEWLPPSILVAGILEWPVPLIFGLGIYTHWLLVVSKSFNWQRFLMPIKNFFQSGGHSKSVEILVRIGKFVWVPTWWFLANVIKFWARFIGDFFSTLTRKVKPVDILKAGPLEVLGFLGIFLVVMISLMIISLSPVIVALQAVVQLFIMSITTAMLVSFVSLGLICTGLDTLFYLGFNIPIVVCWAFWGFVIGLAIQAYRSIGIYDQKGMKTDVAGVPPLSTETYDPKRQKRMKSYVAVAPVLLLCVVGTIRYVDYVRASNSPSPETAVIAAQGTVGLDAETITDPAPEPDSTKQTTPESGGDPILSEAPVSITVRQEVSAPLTPQIQTASISPKQEAAIIPAPVPKPITPTVPSDMVFIPAGEFQMGSNDNTDEKPVHPVYIDAFHIDKYEVTNAQYKAFVDANPQWRQDQIPSTHHNGNYLKHWNGNDYPSGKGDHPVVYVSWYGAMAYAQWTGKRLPTEAEWEKAARGGKSGLKYPWGNTISNGQANYGNHIGDTTVVGSYPANGYGLYDMAGNVLEWCLDAYYGDFYFFSPHRNPLGGVNTIENANLVISDFTNVTTGRVVRSGAWYNTEIQSIRVAYRNRVLPTLTNVALGFRCAKTATPLDSD